MSLARFAAMAVPRRQAENGRLFSQLFLPRADLLGDPFEGSIPSSVKKLRNSDPWFQSFPPGYHEAFRKWTFVSCWHSNRGESAALWQLYAQSEGSVAVRSTYSRIRKALAHIPDRVAVSRVAYIDYDNDNFRFGDPRAGSQPFLHKRLSFEHEHEVRIIRIVTPPAPTPNTAVTPTDFLQDQPMPGTVFHVSLAELVETVYVSPDAPPWIRPTIEAMLRSWGWEIPVQQSRAASIF